MGAGKKQPVPKTKRTQPYRVSQRVTGELAVARMFVVIVFAKSMTLFVFPPSTPEEAPPAVACRYLKPNKPTDQGVWVVIVSTCRPCVWKIRAIAGVME